MKTAYTLELSGLDGSNPVGFLAALGVSRLLSTSEVKTPPLLSWTRGLRPMLHTADLREPAELTSCLIAGLRTIVKEGVADLGDVIKVEAEQFRKFVTDGYQELSERRLLFAAAYGSDGVLDDGKIVPSQLSFSNGQGGKLLLRDFKKLVHFTNTERLRSALFEPWRYDDWDQPTFRWDPTDFRLSAHMAIQAQDAEKRSVGAANALAFVGLSFLVSVPMGGELQTAAFRKISGQLQLTWPLWDAPLNADAISCLLQQKSWASAQGVFASFGSRKIEYKKNLYLANSTAIDGTFEEA
jgi:hypothetical protein